MFHNSQRFQPSQNLQERKLYTQVLSQFVIDHAPETYSYENAVWQVADVRHSIEDKNWTTTIVAQVRPLTIL